MEFKNITDMTLDDIRTLLREKSQNAVQPTAVMLDGQPLSNFVAIRAPQRGIWFCQSDPINGRNLHGTQSLACILTFPKITVEATACEFRHIQTLPAVGGTTMLFRVYHPDLARVE